MVLFPRNIPGDAQHDFLRECLMFTRLVAMKRRPDLSSAEFRRHWREVYGPLMAQVPGVHYQQNHVVGTKQTTSHARGTVR